jgi:hypothetical protein
MRIRSNLDVLIRTHAVPVEVNTPDIGDDFVKGWLFLEFPDA